MVAVYVANQHNVDLAQAVIIRACHRTSGIVE